MHGAQDPGLGGTSWGDRSLAMPRGKMSDEASDRRRAMGFLQRGPSGTDGTRIRDLRRSRRQDWNRSRQGAGTRPRRARSRMSGSDREIKHFDENAAALGRIAGPRFLKVGSSRLPGHP